MKESKQQPYLGGGEKSTPQNITICQNCCCSFFDIMEHKEERRRNSHYQDSFKTSF